MDIEKWIAELESAVGLRPEDRAEYARARQAHESVEIEAEAARNRVLEQVVAQHAAAAAEVVRLAPAYAHLTRSADWTRLVAFAKSLEHRSFVACDGGCPLPGLVFDEAALCMRLHSEPTDAPLPYDPATYYWSLGERLTLTRRVVARFHGEVKPVATFGTFAHLAIPSVGDPLDRREARILADYQRRTSMAILLSIRRLLAFLAEDRVIPLVCEELERRAHWLAAERARRLAAAEAIARRIAERG